MPSISFGQQPAVGSNNNTSNQQVLESSSDPSAIEPKRLPAIDGIENLLGFGDRLISGGEPHGEEAFAGLKQLGVSVIISVDGLPPDTIMAARYGIRYVHIPMGYSGISPEAVAAFTRVMQDNKGKIFVHCHHGKHRGPAAVAVCGLSAKLLNKQQATKILELAGTSRDYPGLWKGVTEFQPASADQLQGVKLTERVEAPSLSLLMAEIDRDWERIVPKDWTIPLRPKIQTSLEQSAVNIRQHFEESERLVVDADQSEMKKRLLENAKLADQLLVAIRASDQEKGTLLHSQLSRNCKDCHAQYRN